MAPKVHSKWLEHGWRIVANAIEKPFLWITDFPIEEGRYWSTLGNSYGVIESLVGTIDEGLIVAVTNSEMVFKK
jgi:hypothetical protein